MIQFKHPELLWALVLLIIPIIIHLFHLRRFKKTPFTNVAFLRTIKITTRKSSQLKKWLVLLTRLGMLSMLILAFAQPFLPNTENFNKPSELVIYLDNSFSMQAKGSNGSLLNEAKQQLLNYLPDQGKLTLYTNNQSFTDVSKESILNELIDIDYSSTPLSFNAAYLKGCNYFKNKESLKNLVFISDFQNYNLQNKDSLIQFGGIQLEPQNSNNISIDSVYLTDETNRKEITVKLSNFGSPVENVAVSLYNKDILITKASTAIDEEAEVQFTLSDSANFYGKLDLLDNGLTYDNRLFFNIGKTDKIKVLSINESMDFYLRKIYTNDEFNYSAFNYDSIDYSKLQDQNLVILNHLTTLPEVLINAVVDFHSNGGSVLIIPQKDGDYFTYNNLLNQLKQPLYVETSSLPKQITEISFEHPLLSDAFYNKISNFQYPEVKAHFKRSNNTGAVYSLENGRSLLTGLNRVFSFSADINSSNSNFKNSPLIVPALYNIGKQSLLPSELYYNLAEPNTVVIKENLKNEDVINLKGVNYSSIPRQRIYGKYIEVTTLDDPYNDGHYSLNYKSDTLRELSFNYLRNESQLSYSQLSNYPNITEWNSVAQAISEIKSNTDVKALWKWFAIFALVLLLLEMLILKYFK